MKKKRLFALLVCLCLLLCGCGHELDNYRPIKDVNDLEGRKIGVPIAWASDYILSERDGKDLLLYRYDTTADMMMALYYHQIDAICVDLLECLILQATNGDGIHVVENPVSTDGYLCYFNSSQGEARDDFNEFLAAYHETEEFKDLYDRLIHFDGVTYPAPEQMHPNGHGKMLRLAYCMDYYPYCYIDTDGTARGFDMEILYAFADAYDYELELTPTAYEDMMFGTNQGRYDIGLGTISKAYAKEAAAMGILTSDTYYDLPLYLVELNEGAKPVMDDSMYVYYN